MTPEITTTNTKRTYYSSSGCLVININNGHRVTESGSGLSKIIGQRVVEFSPMADGYGQLITDDPEVIEKMDLRMRADNGDVFDSVEYTRRTTPIELRHKMLEEQNQRTVTEYNRLLAKLEAEGKSPKASEGKSSK